MTNITNFEIIIRSRQTGQIIQQTIRVDEEIAANIVDRMELMLASLSKQARITKIFKADGSTITEVELLDELSLPPPSTNPSFEETFRRRNCVPKLPEAT